MQTLKQRYETKKIRKQQHDIVVENLISSKKYIKTIKEGLLSEEVSKETIKQAVDVIKKLSDVAKIAQVPELDKAIKAIREKINTNFKQSPGGISGFIKKIAQDALSAARTAFGLQTLEKNPILYAMEFADALIDGFTKLSDVVELHGVNVPQSKPTAPAPTPAPAPATTKAEGKKKTKKLIEANTTPVANTAPTTPDTQKATSQPTTEQTIQKAIEAADAKYKGKVDQIIRKLFSTDKFKDFINEKEFIQGIMNIKLTQMSQIGQALSGLKANADSVKTAVGAPDATAAQATSNQPTSPEEIQKSTQQLAAQIAHQLTNNKMGLKFDANIEKDIYDFIMSKIPKPSEPAKPAAQPAATTQQPPQ